MVTSGFFDNSCLFRVVPGFVVQFGIANSRESNKRFGVGLIDEPVKSSNVKGSVTFATAGPDSRTSQVGPAR